MSAIKPSPVNRRMLHHERKMMARYRPSLTPSPVHKCSQTSSLVAVIDQLNFDHKSEPCLTDCAAMSNSLARKRLFQPAQNSECYQPTSAIEHWTPVSSTNSSNYSASRSCWTKDNSNKENELKEPKKNGNDKLKPPISPGSQRSQDSGFSDSDVSSECKQSIETNTEILVNTRVFPDHYISHAKSCILLPTSKCDANDSQQSISTLDLRKSKNYYSNETIKKSQPIANELCLLSTHDPSRFQTPIFPISNSSVVNDKQLANCLSHKHDQSLENQSNIISQLHSTLDSHVRLRSYNSSTAAYKLDVHQCLRIHTIPSSCLRSWLYAQVNNVESECMNMLQSKSVISDMSHLLALSARNARANIRHIQSQARTVSKSFSKMFNTIVSRDIGNLMTPVNAVCEAIGEFVYQSEPSDTNAQIQRPHLENLHKLRRLTGEMRVYVDTCYRHNRTLRMDELTQIISSLAEAFNYLIDWMLGEEGKVLLSAFDAGNADTLCLKLALRSLLSAANDSSRMCRILTSLGAVVLLLDILSQRPISVCADQILRALAAVCSVQEAVIAFETCDGLRQLCTLLQDSNVDESVQVECVSLLCQITCPSTNCVRHLHSVSHYVCDLTAHLTRILNECRLPECQLACAAGLANLTFINLGAVRSLHQNDTVLALISAIYKQQQSSVYLQDQVATILANMASIVECHASMLQHGVFDLLVGFIHQPLQTMPALDTVKQPDESQKTLQSRVLASERVLQKSAIALSRFCVSHRVSCCVIESSVFPRIVHLCRQGSLRNHSDGVLVACLTVLRKVYKSISLVPAPAAEQSSVANPAYASECVVGTDVTVASAMARFVNCMDLVQPRLIESFLACSSRHESHV